MAVISGGVILSGGTYPPGVGGPPGRPIDWPGVPPNGTTGAFAGIVPIGGLVRNTTTDNDIYENNRTQANPRFIQLGGLSVLTVLGGLSTDEIPEGSELTIDPIGHSIEYPAYTDQHVLIWRLGTEPDLVSVVFASDPTDLNQLGAWTLWPNPVTLTDGRVGRVLVSNQLLTDVGDTLELA